MKIFIQNICFLLSFIISTHLWSMDHDDHADQENMMHGIDTEALDQLNYFLPLVQGVGSLITVKMIDQILYDNSSFIVLAGSALKSKCFLDISVVLSRITFNQLDSADISDYKALLYVLSHTCIGVAIGYKLSSDISALTLYDTPFLFFGAHQVLAGVMNGAFYNSKCREDQVYKNRGYRAFLCAAGAGALSLALHYSPAARTLSSLWSSSPVY